jgi:hypothetical protein
MEFGVIFKYENLKGGSLLGSLDCGPGLLAEGAGVLLLRGPLADAVRVVGVVACAPGDHAGLAVGNLVGLALEAGLVDAVLADGAVLHRHVPAPQRHCVPLLHLDALVDLHQIIIIISQRITI